MPKFRIYTVGRWNNRDLLLEANSFGEAVDKLVVLANELGRGQWLAGNHLPGKFGRRLQCDVLEPSGAYFDDPQMSRCLDAQVGIRTGFN